MNFDQENRVKFNLIEEYENKFPENVKEIINKDYYEPKFMELPNGEKVCYIEEGFGPVVIFIHDLA